MTVYMGLIHTTKSGYDVTFPDAPGCTASGNTPKEVMSAATQALRLWAEAERAAGRDVPEPRNPKVLEELPEVAEDIAEGARLALFVLSANEGVRTRVNITMDTGLLAAVDEAAKMSGQTRSDFLESAARDKIGR